MRRTPVALQPASPQAHPQSSEVSRSRSPDCTKIIKDLWLKGQVQSLVIWQQMIKELAWVTWVLASEWHWSGPTGQTTREGVSDFTVSFDPKPCTNRINSALRTWSLWPINTYPGLVYGRCCSLSDFNRLLHRNVDWHMTMLLDGNVDVIVLTNDLGTRDSHVLPALSPNADHRRITFSLVWFCCHAAQGCASVSSICVQATMYSICGTSTVLCTLRSICLFWWETWKKLPWPRAPARTDNYSQLVQLIDNQRMQRKSKESNRTMRWSKFRVCLGWQLFWRIFQLIQPKALLLSQTQCSPWAPALASPLGLARPCPHTSKPQGQYHRRIEQQCAEKSCMLRNARRLDLRDFHGLLDGLDVRHLHLLLDRHLDNLVLVLDLRHFHLPEFGRVSLKTEARETCFRTSSLLNMSNTDGDWPRYRKWSGCWASIWSCWQCHVACTGTAALHATATVIYWGLLGKQLDTIGTQEKEYIDHYKSRADGWGGVGHDGRLEIASIGAWK